MLDDPASPRPGVDDLWLDRAKDASVVKPPPYVRTKEIPIPIDLFVIAGGIVFYVVKKTRPRATPASPSA